MATARAWLDSLSGAILRYLGSDLPQRGTIEFSGQVTVTDDAGNDKTLVTVGAPFPDTLAADFTTTLIAAQNTTLSFPVLAGETWFLEFLGTTQCSGTGGSKYALSLPSGSTVEGWLETSGATVVTPVLSRIVAGSTLTSAGHTIGTSTPGPDYLFATVTAGTAGNVTLQVASTTNGQTTTIKKGATLTAQKVSPV
jgi:hypothetical protein